MELNIYKQHTETTNGRKTTNDALITLLRAGVIASIMMLVLGAGTTAAVDGTMLSYPFFDGMENGTGNWTYDSPWNLTDEFTHSGNYSWTDSPGDFYQNSVEKSITLKIDLRYAKMPVLSFWHKHSLEPNKDYGYVDVSDDAGATWTTIYFVTGQKPEWQEENIDLTEYALKEDVRIRFRLKTDAQNQYDGWYIDDVKIAETTASVSYPFSDDMETVNLTEDNWISSSWNLLLTPQAHSGTRCWTDSPEGDMPAVKTDSSLTLAGTIDLSTAVNPQMTFWHHREMHYYGYGYVEVSDNYGQSGTYTTLKTYSSTQGDWVQEQVDLSDYVGLSNVRIRFRLYNYYGYGGYDGWYIDDVRIGEPPDAIPPASITNLQNTTYQETYINWTWTDPADDDFSHVMVYLDGSFKTNVTKGIQHYTATGLANGTQYEIGTRTVDDFGNINGTWTNHTAETSMGTTPYDPADTNHDCVVDMMELMAHISKWKSGEVGMMELMTSIGRWKLGTGGYC